MDPLKRMEDALKLIKTLQITYESKRGIRWGIIIKETGEFVGSVGLNNLSLWNKRAEIGYELHPAHWKKGYITEALREVLRYSFEDLGLFRIGAVTFPKNERSIKLLQRLDFVKEGILRGYLYQGNLSHDTCLFSLLRKEWKNCNYFHS